MMRNQKGLTMSGFMTWAVILIIVALLGFKIAPPYWEETKIKKMLKILSEDPSLATGSRPAIDRAFQLRNAIDDVTSIAAKDIEVVKEGTGIVLSASYSARVPLVYNLSACMDFNPSSR